MHQQVDRPLLEASPVLVVEFLGDHPMLVHQVPNRREFLLPSGLQCKLRRLKKRLLLQELLKKRRTEPRNLAKV